MKTVRWGILGAANIARKNWEAIRLSGTGIVTAVASRDAAKAQAFVDDCQAEAPFPHTPGAVGGYEALLARDDVDAVYIPLPTGVRPAWVERAAAAGKHVLCEKPCAADASQLERMVAACEQAGVQFMDGVMFQHSIRLDAIRSVLDNAPGIGRIRRVESAFSFLADDDFGASNIRGAHGLEPLGCLGDLGWYNVRFALWALGWQMPRAVTARCLRWMAGRDGLRVPAEVHAELSFDDGVSAGFHCSFTAGDQQWAHISGTAGHIRVPDFVLPFDGKRIHFEVRHSGFVVKGCDFRMHGGLRTVAVDEAPTRDPGSQESRMFRRFNDCVLGGKPDPFWPRIALQTQRVIDACQYSLNFAKSDVAP